MKRFFSYLAAVAAVLTLTAGPALADTIKIACASPFTGGAAAYGENIKAGIEMKLEEVNAAGGINGKQVEVVYFDEQCNPTQAATVAPKIAGDTSLVGIIGHLCSGAHLAALPQYTRRGVPAISPTATNVAISDQNKDRNGNVWSFRNVYRDDFQGQFLALYVKNILGLDTVAVFNENNDYGIGLKDAFVGQAEKIGLNVVGVEAYVSGAQDFTPQLTKLKGANPQAIFIAGYYNEGALIASQAAKLGMEVAKFGADGLDNEKYIELAGAAAENTYLTTPFLPAVASKEGQEFAKAFEAKYGRTVDYMSANAYDATGLLLKAIAEAGADRAKVQEYLISLDTPAEAYIGVTGATYFNEHGDSQKSAFVKMVSDGAFVPAPDQM